jgi:hypothetical protein
MLKLNSILSKNIEWYFMQIQFNSTFLLKFNWIEFKFKKNGMQILWRTIWIFKNIYGVEKRNLKEKFGKDTIPCLFTWEWAKQNFHLNDDHNLWNLKMSYLNQLQWSSSLEFVKWSHSILFFYENDLTNYIVSPTHNFHLYFHVNIYMFLFFWL